MKFHEAISREESSVYTEGILVEEFRRGIMLKGRLLRPAMVKVSAGPGPKKAPLHGEKFTDQPISNSGTGQVLWFSNHFFMQFLWYLCLHGVSLTSPSVPNPSKQIGHRASSSSTTMLADASIPT
ncbi:grpE protein [Nymphaea thermarum]|nr:grpE protein [Nymphaea thermarum]